MTSLQVSITTPSGEVKTQECLTGADIVVQAGNCHLRRPSGPPGVVIVAGKKPKWLEKIDRS